MPKIPFGFVRYKKRLVDPLRTYGQPNQNIIWLAQKNFSKPHPNIFKIWNFSHSSGERVKFLVASVSFCSIIRSLLERQEMTVSVQRNAIRVGTAIDDRLEGSILKIGRLKIVGFLWTSIKTKKSLAKWWKIEERPKLNEKPCSPLLQPLP